MRTTTKLLQLLLIASAAIALLISPSLSLLNASKIIPALGVIRTDNSWYMNFESASDFQTGTGTFWDNTVSSYGLQFSGNVFEQTPDIVHGGAYSARLAIENPIDDSRRRLHFERDLDSVNDLDIWLEVWYYLPLNFQMNNWINIHRAFTERIFNAAGDATTGFQGGVTLGSYSGWKISNTEYKPAAGVGGPVNGVNVQSLPDTLFRDTIRLGEWFKITTFVHRDLTRGVFRVWLNDVLQVERINIRTIGSDPAEIANIRATQGANKAWVSSGIALYSGDLPNISPKEIRVDDVTLTLGNIPSPVYTLTMQSSPNGTTTPSSGTYTYSSGVSVPLVATPNLGYRFDYWIINGVSNPLNQTSISITENTNVTPVFSLLTEEPPPPVTSQFFTNESIILASVFVGAAVYLQWKEKKRAKN